MLIHDKTREKVRAMLSRGDEFMLYRLPGRTVKLVTSTKPKVDVRIVPWNTSVADAVILADRSEPSFSIPASTQERYYLDRVNAVITRLKERGMAKTVISRIIAGRSADADWLDIADNLWQTYPDTFGYMFYSASTGGWVGATPEKLLFTFSPRSFTTCALAGTLPVDQPWNRKNYDEQQMVSDFIKDTLSRMGLEFKETGPRTIRFGAIKHLMTNFAGEMTDPSAQTPALLDSLAPTPALSGSPRAEAIADIADMEQHQRGCYGGYIYLSDGMSLYTFVTIRCAQFDPRDGSWAIYAGGGITPASVAEDEWKETEAKAATLLGLIEHKQH